MVVHWISVGGIWPKCRLNVWQQKKLANGNLNVSESLLASFVGMTRLELATTRPPDVYANQLRYIPIAEGKQSREAAVCL